MAIHSPITPIGARKAPALSGLALAFTTFLLTFEAFIEAERDLGRVDGFDPAYAHWLRDAELAQERMTTELMALRGFAPQSELDVPVLRMVAFIHLLLGTEDATAFQRLHGTLQPRMMRYFQLPGKTPAIRQHNVLLGRASVLIDHMVALPLFSRDGAEISQDDLQPQALPLAF